MQPFERLRHLARWTGGDDAAFVSEAADCLAGFADDPAGLVVACRRLLVHHPGSGRLWWLCAQVLAAAEPATAAGNACRRLEEDRTTVRMAERLPFPHDEPVVLVGQPDLVAAVATTRPDLHLLAVRLPGDPQLRARLRRADSPAQVVNEHDAGGLRPSHVVVEATAASPTRVTAAAGTARLLDGMRATTTTWLVAGVGRVLPERLFDSLARQVEAGEDDPSPIDILEPARFDRVAGPAGLDPPASLARRVDCPVAPELLRLE